MERKHPNLISPHIPNPRSPEYPSFHHPNHSGLLIPPESPGSSLSPDLSRRKNRVKGRFPFLPMILVIFMAFTYTGLAQTPAQIQSETADTAQMIPDSLRFAPTWDEDLSLKGQIDKTSLPQNDTLKFTATIRLVGNPMLYRIEDIDNPKVSNLDMISSSSSNKTVVEDGNKVFYRQYEFNYIPNTMGMAYINPTALNVEFLPTGQKRLLRSTRLEIEVTDPILPKDSHLALFILIPVALVFIGFGIYILFRRRSDTDEELIPEKPIEQEYLDQLAETRQYLTKGNFPSFYEKAQAITKEYITRKWDIPAKSLPREELIRKLDEAGLGAKILKELSDSFATCDRIRFAREATDETEAHRVYAAFEKLIKSFKPVGTAGE